MKNLSDNEMKKIKGSAGISVIGLGLGISIIISFIIGVISGYTDPCPCGGE